MNKILCAFACAATMATVAQAEEEFYTPRSFVALGAGVVPDYSGSDDYEIIPFGAAQLATEQAIYKLQGPALKADVLSPATQGRWVGGPVLKYRFGRDDVDNTAVDRLPEIDDAVELGGYVGYRFQNVGGTAGTLTTQVEATADVSDAHEGYNIQPSMNYAWRPCQNWFWNIGLSADFGSDDFVETYYNIDAAGATASGLPQYNKANAGLYQATASVSSQYNFNQNWGVFSQVAATQLVGDAADSPLVKDETGLRAGVALSYSF